MEFNTANGTVASPTSCLFSLSGPLGRLCAGVGVGKVCAPDPQQSGKGLRNPLIGSPQHPGVM